MPSAVPFSRTLGCCRSRLALPSAGPEALPTNFALKAIIEKCRQEEQQEQGTCRAHPRQPLSICCLRERQCITIGRHRGHAIHDLRSACRRAREASGSSWGRCRSRPAPRGCGSTRLAARAPCGATGKLRCAVLRILVMPCSRKTQLC